MQIESSGYMVAVLDATGWRMPSVVQYRYRDAHEWAMDRLGQGVSTRAVRIHRVSVDPQAIFTQEREDERGGGDE